ncbi:hypothetical protein [Azospirillum brasilense]|uniref:hypothetical protein n=1 Tax=Azospirillum brasilense TaxID=192 RepID=UPI000E68A793|nr:hypothetical protein [Azospirillum brasilense]NUB24700.1 hypothetical protein [Azospirillum brasilense]NUB30696.1 hypothetical protein [Azospirillum brasilense]RIW08305.1 hypothetical protein D2T81_00920 [Azospirillum brasilense]
MADIDTMLAARSRTFTKSLARWNSGAAWGAIFVSILVDAFWLHALTTVPIVVPAACAMIWAIFQTYAATGNADLSVFAEIAKAGIKPKGD